MEMKSVLSGYKTLTYYGEVRNNKEVMMRQNITFRDVDVNEFNEIVLSSELHDGICILNPNLSYEILPQPYTDRDRIVLKQDDKHIITLVGKK